MGLGSQRRPHVRRHVCRDGLDEGGDLGGVGFLLDAVTRGKTVAHTVARLRVSGRDTYRIDYTSRSGRNNPTTIACDGQRRRQAYPATTMVGAAAPLPDEIANLVDSSWLLRCRLSGGTELSYRGRRAYQFGATRGSQDWPVKPLLFFPVSSLCTAAQAASAETPRDVPGRVWQQRRRPSALTMPTDRR